ncbi:hypothetical protein BRADI_5g01035v3 [Brachypodium distachyon]|uniref:Uncharacterized protein n=1 Tax=Brachypodium distachyon TaxID=15368 RepID=A0A2K2CER1_BRADI|nr:hypothetical protein BRADI_5g01035v3 [Brachypodium distachyon]
MRIMLNTGVQEIRFLVHPSVYKLTTRSEHGCLVRSHIDLSTNMSKLKNITPPTNILNLEQNRQDT